MDSLRRVFGLIRHGDYAQQPGAPSAHQPHGLTETGFEQAADAAAPILAFAKQEGLTLSPYLHASTLRRAWETALTLCKPLNIADGHNQISTTDLLTERSVGALSNLNADEITTIISADPRFDTPPKDWKSNSFYCLPVPGAESLMEAGERVARYLSDLDQRPNNHNELVLIIGHGASIRHAAYHLGIIEFADIAKLSMFHAQPVFIENTPSGWQKIGGEWKVRGQKTEYTD